MLSDAQTHQQSRLKNDIPVLLLPVKLETKFMGQELWVRIYPDDIMLDRHEPRLSPGEKKAGWRYRRANRVVGMAALEGKLYCATEDNKLWMREASPQDVGWQHIGHANRVVGMAAFEGKLYCATEDNKLWMREASPQDIGWQHIGHANRAVGMAAFEGKLYCATEDNKLCKLSMREASPQDVSYQYIGYSTNYQDAWRELSQRFGPARAAWIVRQMDLNHSESDLRYDPLIKPSTLCVLPDRFEIFVYRGEKLEYWKSGNPTGGESANGFTLHAPLPLGFQPDANGEPSNTFLDLYDDNSRWMIDFNRALEVGMAVKIKLNDGDCGPFSKVIAVGIKRTDSNKGLDLLQALLDHHHYTNGLAFLAKDTPTNNTDQEKSGFSDTENHDLAFKIEIEGADGWDNQKSNAQWLGQALGVNNGKHHVFQDIALAADMTEAFAEELNKALWPATGDYFLRHMLSDISTGISLLSEKTLAKVAQHFGRFVRGEGPLPSIRVGDQPYGILPVTCFGKTAAEGTPRWQASALDHREQSDEWVDFDTQLHGILSELAKKWLKWAANTKYVPRIQANSRDADADRDLLRILAMEPVSTSYWLRTFVGEGFIGWCMKELRNYAFSDDIFPGSPLEWMLNWAEHWHDKRRPTAKLLSEIIGIQESNPIFEATVNKFDETALFRILSWSDGQNLPISLLERPKADSPETHQYLEKLCGPAWKLIGSAENVIAMTALKGKLYCATSDNKLLMREVSDQERDWENIGWTPSNIVGLAGLNFVILSRILTTKHYERIPWSYLYCATSDNRLLRRSLSDTSNRWENVCSVENVLTMAGLGSRLYFVTSNHMLRVREYQRTLPPWSDVSPEDLASWKTIGLADDVVELAAMDNFLYGVTSYSELQRRQASPESHSWEPLGYTTHVTGLASLDGMLYRATSEGQLWAQNASNLHPSSEETPEILLLDMLQRSLILSKNNNIDVEPVHSAICNLAKASIPKPILHRLFRGCLDLFTHRLDAWITSLATQRLEAMRQRKPQGIYLGAYGWVENLSRREANENESEGYIHAPSAAQAKAAAVLHNAYLTHQTKTNGQESVDESNPFRINLTSIRVRQALRLLEGVRQGQQLGALLGFQFERALHEQQLDNYIDTFRAAFPIVAKKETESDGENQTVEAMAARNVVDGLTLVRWRKHNYTEPTNITLGDPAAFAEIESILADQNQQMLLEEINNLTNTLDAVSDVLMYEAVYHTVQGNFDRGGAALEAASGNATIPKLESISTQISGTSFGNRVCLLFGKEARSTVRISPDVLQPPEAGPRGQAEPVLNLWFENLLGDFSQIGCCFQFDASNRININTADVRGLERLPMIGKYANEIVEYRRQYGVLTINDLLNLPAWLSALISYLEGKGVSDNILEELKELRDKLSNENSPESKALRGSIVIDQNFLTLANLQIDALDVLYMAHASQNGEKCELEQCIVYYVRKAFGISYDQPVIIDLNDSLGQFPCSFGDTLKLASKVLSVIGGKPYVTPGSLSLPAYAENAAFSEYDVDELRGRVESSLDQLLDLKHGFTGNSIATVDAMFKAGRFGVSGTIPLASDDPRIQELKKTTIRNLEQRSKRCGVLLEKAKAVLSREPNTGKILGTNQAVSYLVEAMQALFEDAFVVLPLVAPHRAEEFEAALNNQEVKGLDPERIRLWLEQAAKTNQNLADLEMMLAYAEAFKSSGQGPFTLRVAQLLPKVNDALKTSPWMALDDEERGTQSRPKGAVSIVMLTPPQGGLSISRSTRSENGALTHSTSLGTCYAGLLIDDWNERIPSEKVDTSVAFQYNQPNTQAPQCLLLAVPGEYKDEPDEWTTDALKDIILDTMDLYKIRAVDPDAMPGVGSILPSLFLPTEREKPGWGRETYSKTIEEWVMQLIQPNKVIIFPSEDELDQYESLESEFLHSSTKIKFIELSSSITPLKLHIGGLWEQIGLQLGWDWTKVLLTQSSQGIRIVLPEYTPRIDIVVGWSQPYESCTSNPNNDCVVAMSSEEKPIHANIEVRAGSSRKIRFYEGGNEYEYNFSTLRIFAKNIKIIDIYGSCAIRILRTYK